MDSVYIILIVVVVVAIVLFLFSRAIMLWYWRINDIVENQEKQNYGINQQNRILEKIFIQLGGSIDTEIVENRIQIDQSTINEDNEIVEKMRTNLKTGEIIVKVKRTGKIEMINKSDWDDIIKIGNQDKFELMVSNL